MNQINTKQTESPLRGIGKGKTYASYADLKHGDEKYHSQSLRINNQNKESETLRLEIENKKKFQKKIYSIKDNTYKYSGSLEYEDAVVFMRRDAYPTLDYSFLRKKSQKKIKRAPSSKLREQRRQLGRTSSFQTSMDFEDIMVAARRRRNLQRRNRIVKLRILHTEVKPPQDYIHPTFPKELDGGYFKVGVSEMKGKRPTMEDRHVVQIEKTKTTVGVFDGHIGYQAAEYVSENIVRILRSKLLKKEVLHLNIDPREIKLMKSKDIRTLVIRDTFLQLNKELKEKNKYGGCCATVLYIRKGRLYVGNVGDAKAILFKRDGTFSQLTEDHTPKNEKEIARIEKMGGKITSGRINGLLNVTRSLGDSFSKLISHDPYTCTLKLEVSTDKFLIVSSDGLWNYVKPADACKKIEHMKDPRVAAQFLRNLAFEKGSTDNITIVVIFFLEEHKEKKGFFQKIKEKVVGGGKPPIEEEKKDERAVYNLDDIREKIPTSKIKKKSKKPPISPRVKKKNNVVQALNIKKKKKKMHLSKKTPKNEKMKEFKWKKRLPSKDEK